MVRRKIIRSEIYVPVIFILGVFFTACSDQRNGLIENDRSYLKQKKNYKNNDSSMFKLALYCKNIIPFNSRVRFAYNNNKSTYDVSIEYFTRSSEGQLKKRRTWEAVEKNSEDFNLVIKELGWSISQFNRALYKLDKTNCVGFMAIHDTVRNEPFQLTYGSGGTTLYSYLIFLSPISDQDKPKYENRLGYGIYNDSVVFVSDYSM